MDDIKALTAEEIAALSPEALAELNEKQTAAWDELISQKAPTAEQIAQAKVVGDNRDLIDADLSRRDTEAEEQAAAFEALKERKFGADKAEDDSTNEPEQEEEPDEGGSEEQEEQPAEEPAQEEQPAQEPAPEANLPVAASAKVTARGGVKALAAKTNRKQDTPVKPTYNPVVLTAAAGARDAEAGARIDLNDAGRMVLDHAQSFGRPDGSGEAEDIRRHGTARFEIQFPDELMVDRMEDSEAAEEAINRATDLSRLPGGSLTAAGWCAPSETVYDLDQDATSEGMVSLPEIGVRRGGLRFAVRPEFATFYASPGFKQTEAQAIANTVKTCITIPCPSFTDVRLDIDGICIKVDILAEVGYPENVANYIAGTLVAHQHWINADVIGRIVTASGARRDFTGLGSVYSDSLEALGLVIDQRRQAHRLSFGHTMEVLLPFWVKNVLKNDLGRRMGRTGGVASDQELTSAFSAMGANVQWLYDWQLLDETAEVYPATFDAVVYPAGTFVKGVTPVIKLDTIYDAASLATNTYTGLFTEQGYLVAKKKLGSDYVRVPICAAGRTGAANFTCA